MEEYLHPEDIHPVNRTDAELTDAHTVTALTVTAFQQVYEQLGSDDVEQWFKWCMRSLLSRFYGPRPPLHATVTSDPRFKQWTVEQAHQLSVADRIAQEVCAASVYNSTHTQLTKCRQNPKVPRYVRIRQLATETLLETLLAGDRFLDADRLLRFTDRHPDHACVAFDTEGVLDVLGALDKAAVAPHDPCPTTTWLMLRDGDKSCVLCMEASAMRRVRTYLIGDLVTDASAIRKHTVMTAPFLLKRFSEGDPLDQYSVLRTLLRFFMVTRVTGKCMLPPSHPAFVLYTYLPMLLLLFDNIREECEASFQAAALVWSDDETRVTALRGSVPSLLRSLRAFIQLDQPHFINGTTLLLVQEALEGDEILRRAFSGVETICNHTLPYNVSNPKIPLDHLTVCVGGAAPTHAHLLLYAFALHPRLPTEVAKEVVLNLFVDGDMVLPRAVKQLDSTKGRGKIAPRSSPRLRSTHTAAQQLYELVTTLEHMSFLSVHIPRRDLHDVQRPFRGRVGQPRVTPSDLTPRRHVVQRVPGSAPLDVQHCWVHRWPEYAAQFIGENRFVLEWLVYFRRDYERV